MNGILLILCVVLLLGIGISVALGLREAWRRRALEEDIARVKHEVEQRRHDYLRAFAHDLRNPLSAVVMVSDLLEDEEDVGLIRSQMAKVKLQALGMVELITRYVELSALDADRYPVGRISMDLKALMEDRVSEFEARAVRKGQTIQVKAGCESVNVMGDPDAGARVLDQVLDNAIKFAPRGSTIKVGLEVHPDWGEAWIQDEGPGFKEVDHRRLFQPCTPLSARPTAGESATGLGLCIAKRLLDLTGGRIEVPVGQGPVRISWPR